jgi:hypothetical protein
MIRWYISPYSGAGTSLDPFHAKCWDYTDPGRDKCSGTRCPQRKHYIVRVVAPQSVHDTIVANNAGTVISPLFNDEASESTALNAPHENVNEKLGVEGHGYPTDWMIGTHTLKDMIRYITKLMHISQRLQRFDLVDRLFTLGLGSTVADLTLTQRTAIRNWLQDRGLDITWITASTTIRQVLHFIASNVKMNKIRIGYLEL